MKATANRRTRREPRRATLVAAPPSPVVAVAQPPRRATALVALAVALVALAVYGLTLAPSVTLVDSGELLAAIDGPGVAHPPGFPLYVMLAHAATRIPLGTVAQRGNAFSALCAALAAGLLVLAQREAVRDGVAEPSAADAAAWTRLVPPAVAGLLLAFSRSFWSFATVTEVYALNTLLVVAILFAMLRWRRAPERDRPLLAAAALFGVALGVHHVTVALLLPGLALLVAREAGLGFFRGRRLAIAAAVALAAAVVVYLYLPWAAARPAGLNWGDTDTFARVVAHVTGRQYQSNLVASAASVRGEAVALAARLGRELGPIWAPAALLLALAGARSLWKRDRSLAAALLVMLGAEAAFALVYTIAEDKEAYSLPIVVVLAFAAGAGARWLLDALAGRRRALAAGALLALPLLSLGATWRSADQSAERVAGDFVAGTLAGIAPQGLLLTSEWQLYSPLVYLQQVEKLRPDVVAVDLLLLRRSWYVDFLARQAPDLAGRVAGEAESFLADLRGWERDPERYAREPALVRRLDDRYHDLILALVARQLERGPAYVTRDVALPPFASDPALPPRLDALYSLVPRGLVFELRADRSFVEPGEVPSPPPGLFDPARPLDPDGPAALKVRPVYLTMWTSRGFYLAGNGRMDEARAAFRAALALDPGFPPARQALERSIPP